MQLFLTQPLTLCYCGVFFFLRSTIQTPLIIWFNEITTIICPIIIMVLSFICFYLALLLMHFLSVCLLEMIEYSHRRSRFVLTILKINKAFFIVFYKCIPNFACHSTECRLTLRNSRRAVILDISFIQVIQSFYSVIDEVLQLGRETPICPGQPCK